MSEEHLTDRPAIIHGKGVRRPPGVSVEDWFWSYVRKTETCWLWEGYVRESSDGHFYGQFIIDGRQRPAHRVAWQFAGRPDPSPYFVVQTCGNTLCVRIGHLNTSRLEDRFWLNVAKVGPDDCWPWTGNLSQDGYGTIWVRGSRSHPAHRVSWEMHNGPIPAGLFVCHSCDVRYPPGDTTYRKCCNPSHLWLGTSQENTRDRDAKGRSATGGRHWQRKHPERTRRGESVPWAKTTEDEVREVRAKFATGNYTKAALAREYNRSEGWVYGIITGTTWRHVI